jgi:hypothetical protein
MTGPTTSPARKRRRLAGILAAFVLGMSAFGLFVGGGTAYADPACPIYLQGRDVGGNYNCDIRVYWRMPNTYTEVFVIAPDHSVWTIWDSSSGISSWRSLSGWCDFGSLSITLTSNHWQPYLTCTARGHSWFKQRIDQGNGAGFWRGWYLLS